MIEIKLNILLFSIEKVKDYIITLKSKFENKIKYFII